jgi:hypothetical protein
MSTCGWRRVGVHLLELCCAKARALCCWPGPSHLAPRASSTPAYCLHAAGVPKVLCTEVVKHCKVEELQEWEKQRQEGPEAAEQQPVSSQDGGSGSAQSSAGGSEEEL